MGQDPFARDKDSICPLRIILERGLAYLVEVFAIMNIDPNISVVRFLCAQTQREKECLSNILMILCITYAICFV